jgi:hypothetical protein
MALSVRYKPNTGIGTLRTAAGNTVAVSGAPTVDVPYSDDALTIGPDQAQQLDIVGATADRPGYVLGKVNWPPLRMYDTTLAKPIFWVVGSNPASWVGIGGNAV